MKEKLIKWSKPLLLACTIWSFWVGGGIASIVLLGEYPYPSEEQ